MNKCSQCRAVLGSKFVGPAIRIVVAHDRLTLCPGCAVSLAESLYAQVRNTQGAAMTVQQRMDPNLTDLARGMK